MQTHNLLEKCLKTIVFFIAAGACAWLMWYLPPHADEFVKYQRLACFSFEGSAYNTFQLGCDKYLATFMGFQFHKNYDYFGVTSNFLYAPLYFLAPNIYSHYIYGILVLLIFSILLTKALELKWHSALIPFLFFPVAYSLIHDIGPISLALISYPIFIIAIAKLLNKKQSIQASFKWLLAIFFITFFAMEDKTFYIYLLPQIIFIAIASFMYQETSSDQLLKKVRNLIDVKFFIKVILFFMVIMLAVGLVLFATNIDGQSYYHFLKGYRAVMIRENNLERGDIFYSLFNFLLTPILMVHRTLSIPDLYQLISKILFLPVFFIIGYFIWRKKNIALILILLSDILLAIAFIYSNTTWASHHYIFLFLPLLILLMLLANSSKTYYWITISLLLINLIGNTLFASLSPVQSHASNSRKQIFEYLTKSKIAKDSVINFSSFGGYSIQALYGDKDQVVVWQNFANKNASQILQKVLNASSRKFILNVCDSSVDGNSSCNFIFLKNEFPDFQVQQIGPTDSNWQIWKISPKIH